MKLIDLDYEFEELNLGNMNNRNFKIPKSFEKGMKARYLLSQELSKRIDNIYFKNICWQLQKLLSWFYSPKETRVVDINMAYEVKQAIELMAALNLFSKNEEEFNKIMEIYEKCYIDTMIDYCSNINGMQIEKFRNYNKNERPSLNITNLVRENTPKFLNIYKLLNKIVHLSFKGTEDTKENIEKIMFVVKEISENMAAEVLRYLKHKSEYVQNRMYTLFVLGTSKLYE